MVAFVARIVILSIILAVAGAVGMFISSIRTRSDIRNLPQPEERARLLHELRTRRQQRACHAECMQYLESQGLRKGVAQGMIIDLEREQPPDLSAPKMLNWHRCSCQYPGNWRANAIDESTGSNAGVSLEGLGSAMFLLIRKEEPSDMENLLLDEYASQLSDHTTTAIASWGDLPGRGIHVSGVDKLQVPMDITVFKPDTSTMRFILVEYCAKEEADIMTPAFQLIQSTFKIG